MLYAAVKHLHIVCVVLSITGFCLRGVWLGQKSALARRLNERRWFRILPHVNDSILLAAALLLVVLLGQYPFVDAWLTAKVLGLVAYISLGMLALKAGRSPRVRVAAGLAAVTVFTWIVSVAFTKNPLGLLA
ncbi:MAG: SirB2 family protein [Rhodocyclaceae bacterium]|nr:SirB2 family protein [Rhodocyclaceae bacterium]